MKFRESVKNLFKCFNSLPQSHQKGVVPFSSLWLIEYVLITFNYRALINPDNLLRLKK